ncbi:MAG: response regulator [Candidatus Edwardsbacteria bacterium]|nr:response regulator [Candidatus Edwardsbacteria bacterium]MBU1575607.1 response regulator [Candidatus Edwardsbacteria bacterium]MBU2462643.1 response regulator [Candidatus Edwardsbacteria bacterium]MBU2594426.1 response regulator [Candidatus Edwardsbacteria bacterium]
MSPDASGRTVILAVDDEEDILELIKMVLEEAGYVMLTALSGHEALQILYRTKPDLILMDIMMPGLDGMELIKILKIMDSSASIPIAVVSAKTDPADRLAAIQENAVDYICKPFSPPELVKRVKEILKGGNNNSCI